MAGTTVPLARGVSQVSALLDLPQIGKLIGELDDLRWTGRPGYPIRSMVGLALVKAVYTLPTWTRAVRLVAEHVALRDTLGATPSIDAAYRFTAKLKANGEPLDQCIQGVLAGLKDRMPEFGIDLAIDGSDLPAFANGMKHLANGELREQFSDPDATWGHRSAISTRKGGGYYGFKVHAAVCTRTGLPVAWRTRTASESEHESVTPLLDGVLGRGFQTATCALDKGYDASAIYAACEARNVRPVIPLRMTVNVANGHHKPPRCDHGEWTFAGSDAKRGAAKWRCPTGGCTPASVWIKADRMHTLIPRTTEKWRTLYAHRVMVERAFGELKHEWAMLPLRVRSLSAVALHVDLTILARLGAALTTARQAALAA